MLRHRRPPISSYLGFIFDAAKRFSVAPAQLAAAQRLGCSLKIEGLADDLSMLAL